MTSATIYLRTEWDNGSPAYLAIFSGVSIGEASEIDGIINREGFYRHGNTWRPVGDAKLYRLVEAIRAIGLEIQFEPEVEVPFNLQRLCLASDTRDRLEGMERFRLDELAGYCPVQAQGEFDGVYFYFRARGSHWRFEAGGDESGTKGANWWHEEAWPGKLGIEAGWMSDDDAIQCILKAVEIHRTSDRSMFQEGHPEYEKATLEGWSVGALSLPQALSRLGISAREALGRLKEYGIEPSYMAELEVKAIEAKAGANQDRREMRRFPADRADEGE